MACRRKRFGRRYEQWQHRLERWSREAGPTAPAAGRRKWRRRRPRGLLQCHLLLLMLPLVDAAAASRVGHRPTAAG